MRKMIIFSLILGLVLSMVVNFCYARGYEQPAGEVKVELSAPPELGKVVTFTATFTPLYDADDCEVSFSAGKGIEILEKGTYFDRGTLTNRFIYKKGKIKKGETFSMSIKIRAIRPGVWNISAGFDYHNVPEKHGWYISGDGFWTAVKEDEAIVYKKREEVPLEAWYIPSKIKINPPTDKMRVKKLNGKEGWIAYLTKEHRLDFEPTYQFGVSYYPSGYAAPLPISPDLTMEEKERQRRKIKEELFQKVKPKSKIIWKVIGNIGTIDEQGLFTATRFGKGKIRVEHGKWLSDEIDIEVVPHPNPSPADKIVDVIVVPYETEEERKWVEKVLEEYKKKKFKSKGEAHEKFNPKGAEKGKIKWGDKEKIVDKITIQVGEKKLLIAKGLTADGRIEDITGYWVIDSCYVGRPCNCSLEYIDKMKLKAILTGFEPGSCKIRVVEETKLSISKGKKTYTIIEVKIIPRE